MNFLKKKEEYSNVRKLMGNYITLNRKKHISLLADHRVDPVTKELLKVGDEVCCCAKCKTVYSKNVWISVKNYTCCGQRKMLTEIPNTEYAKFQKKPDKPTKSDDSYGCAFLFFLITTIVFASITYYYYIIYEEEINLKNELYNNLNEKYIKIEKGLNKTEKELNKISSLNFRIGKKNASGNGNYDKNWLMFLEVKYPVRLNHLYVQPFEAGYVTIKLYDFNDNLIHSKTKYLTNPKNLNKVNLDFKIPKEGKYYLKREGKVSLWYHKSNASEYKQYHNDILKIIGCGTTKKNYKRVDYYQYFYNLNFSILIN